MTQIYLSDFSKEYDTYIFIEHVIKKMKQIYLSDMLKGKWHKYIYRTFYMENDDTNIFIRRVI